MRYTIFIVGPRLDRDRWDMASFGAAKRRLSAEWHPISPADIEIMFPTGDEEGRSPDRIDSLIAIELEVARRSDAIYLLKGWEKSPFARQMLAAHLSVPGNGKILLEGDGPEREDSAQ